MRVFILAIGTRGDFEPFWALGAALADAGHQVTLGTSSFHIQPDSRLSWVQIGQASQDEFKRFLASLADEPNLLRRSMAFGRGWAMPQVQQSEQQLTAVAARHDYFIGNMKFPLLRGGQVMPGAYVTYDPPVHSDALRQFGSHLHGGRTLELVAMPRALVDPEASWPAEFHFTGFWHADQHLPSQDAVAPVLPAGTPAPVVLTMGSMVMLDHAALLGGFSQALQQIGRPGVVVGGWSGLQQEAARHPGLHWVAHADYAKLFGQAACVLHHGGAGTVAAVLRAGLPAIVLPHIPSQARWGQILQREKLCTAVLSPTALQPAELLAGLQAACDDPEVRRTAQSWPSRLATDRGLPHAVELIQAHAARFVRA